jgi:hypothetical protein
MRCTPPAPASRWPRGLALLLALGGPALVPTLLGHNDPQAAVPSLRVLKVEAPLVVDGVPDEPFWAQAPVVTGLLDIRTGQPADQQTTMLVAYTRTHLYLAVECFDDQIEHIHASEQRADRSFTGDDWVEIHFDPPHTHRSKYAFFANPPGTRADANEGPSGVFNCGWSAEWDLGGKSGTMRLFAPESSCGTRGACFLTAAHPTLGTSAPRRDLCPMI